MGNLTWAALACVMFHACANGADSGPLPGAGGGAAASGGGAAASGGGAAASGGGAAASGGGTAASGGGTTASGGGTTASGGGAAAAGGGTSASGGGAAGGSPGTADFQSRCTAAGVLRCVGFDQPSDLDGQFGDNHGTLPGTDNLPQLDTQQSASGASSLRFTVSSSSANSGGSYWLNFSDDLLTQIDSNQELFVQWRQRFSSQYVTMDLASYGAGGWKQIIVGAGDKPGCTRSTAITIDSGGSCAQSCSALETNVQDTFFRGFPQMYNSCTGSSSTQGGKDPSGTPPYNPFEEPFGTYDFKLQNAMPSPYCLYSHDKSTYFPPQGNCFGYVADEWMTFKMHIALGARTNDYFKDSHVDLWVARDGQPSQQVFNWGPYDLAAGQAAQSLKYGKLWLLSYDSNNAGNNGASVPTAYTWYDELIISANDIADPL